MTKEATLVSAKKFPITESSISLWTFKKKTPTGYSAKSVVLSDELIEKVRAAATRSLARVTEVDDYALLAQVTEANCLYLEDNETNFHELQALVDEPPEEHVMKNIRDLQNAAGYLVRFWHAATKMSLYCVKKVGSDWIAQRKKGGIYAILRDNKLELIEEPALTLSDQFDFFCFDEKILVTTKRAFESVLRYKIVYQNSFASLQKDPVFTSIFVDMAPLIEHVGTNTMHLRRMAVIEQRAYYANPAYMQRLRAVCANRKWDIKFDNNGRIFATQDNMKDVMQVLLNHRLFSELSLESFDVPSTAPV